MAISPSLQQFKSSGVYRLEFDKSQITNIPSETIRLIIGFSKKGPFNTPVLCKDTVFFKEIFGDIDTTLERKGSFFHRTALVSLDRGPVIVLNLLNLDDTLDQSQFRSISTASWQANSPVKYAPVSNYFNQDKFWFTDAQALIDTADNSDYQSVVAQRLLNVANVGRKNISIFTKKSTTLGFDVLAKDWYGTGKVPDFINENDYISDYMIDLIIVEGDFSDYQSLAIDPIYGTYFDSTGLKTTITDSFGNSLDGLTQFLNLNSVNVLGVYTGCLIPEFQDKNGNNLFIQDLVNLETSKTGLLLGINQETIDDDPETIGNDLIDLVGHGIESQEPTVVDFLSYYGPIVSSIPYVAATGIYSLVVGATYSSTLCAGAQAMMIASASLTGASSTNGWNSNVGHFDTLLVYGPSASLPAGYSSKFTSATEFATFRTDISVDNTFIKAGASNGVAGASGNYSYLSSESYDSSTDILTLKISNVAGAGVTGPTSVAQGYYRLFATGLTAGGTASLPLIKSVNFNFAEGGNLFNGVANDLYQANLSGIITDGDKIKINNTGATAVAYAEFTRVTANDFTGATFTNAAAFGNEAPVLNAFTNYIEVNAYTNSDLSSGATAILPQTTYVVNTLTGDINESFPLWGGTSYTNPTNVVWVDNGSTGPLGLNGFNGQIIKNQLLLENFGGTGGATTINPTTGKSRLTRILSVSEVSDPTSALYKKIKITTVDPIYISGTSEIERYKEASNFVTHYRVTALKGYTLRSGQMPDGSTTRQNEILDVMYNSNIAAALADRETITFRYIIDSFQGTIEPATKIRLTKLAKNRQSALAICNMPSVKQFKDSTNPLFKLNSSTQFDAAYIADGGNLSLNPSNIFTLPGIADGANYSAFYGPNLTIREAGKNTSVPSAAYVGNLYIDKYTQALPYSIVAGPRRGVVTGTGLVGVEYNFDRTDLDSIEPFGYNAIVNKRGFGLTINANQTAQQTIKSALSQVHVRELLIYIQDGIEAILKNYRWEFNTANNRLEIKTLADNFLSQILADGGVYDFQNIMDTTNNTTEIIDNNFGILDTYIEPVRGMGILVHRTTILRTGAISTGNFM
jgi:hypothetical protein